MIIKSILDCEKNSLEKMKKIQLPHSYKKIGITLAIISFVLLFINAFTINEIVYREIIKYGILIGLLIISISKEEIEDELVTNLRMQSYSLSFIIGVAYSLVIPLIDYLFDIILKTDNANLKDMGNFQILWMLLIVQIFYFEYLKKMYK